MARVRFDPEGEERAKAFARKLRAAREKRGWTWNAATSRSKRWFDPRYQLSNEQLKKLENGQTDPLTVMLSTSLALAELFYPDLKLSDFTGNAGPFKLQPIDSRTADRLRYRS